MVSFFTLAPSMRVTLETVCTNKEIEMMAWFGASAGELGEGHVPWHAWFEGGHLLPEQPRCSSVVR